MRGREINPFWEKKKKKKEKNIVLNFHWYESCYQNSYWNLKSRMPP